MVKANQYGSMSRLKARNLVNIYAQTYVVDYLETLSLVTILFTIHFFISLATKSYSSHNLDIKNNPIHVYPWNQAIIYGENNWFSLSKRAWQCPSFKKALVLLDLGLESSVR